MGLDFIFKMTNEKLKRDYLKKYFNRFTRISKPNENKNFFFNKFNDKPVLCKHYYDLVYGEILIK